MKTKKFAVIMSMILMVAFLVTSVSITAALWSDASGGDTGIAPAVTTGQWDSWAKYFTYDGYNASGTRVAQGIASGGTATASVSYFKVVGYTGTNLGDLVFPATANYVFNGTEYSAPVTHVNSLFSSIALDELLLTVHISPYIEYISPSVFSGMTNLQTVTFDALSDSDTSPCKIYENAFGSCTSLTKVVFEGRQTIKFKKGSFAGCTALTTITKNNCNFYYSDYMSVASSFTAGTTYYTYGGNAYSVASPQPTSANFGSETYYVPVDDLITAANFTTTKNYIFIGAVSLVSPF